MSLSIRRNGPIVIPTPTNINTYWSADSSGNILNTNLSGDISVNGQIIGANGYGIVDQVLALNSNGNMIWKDVSGTGGLANAGIITNTNISSTLYPVLVDGSGNKPFFINQSSLVFNNQSLGIGKSPAFNIDVSGTANITGNVLIRSNTDISQGTLTITTNTSTGNSIILNKLNPSRDNYYNSQITFQENGVDEAYIWHQADVSGQLEPSMLRLGNGSGTTSWSIATNQINKLSYGHPSGQRDTLVGIRYGYNGNTDASVNKILHISNNDANPLVFTTTGRLGVGTTSPEYNLDVVGTANITGQTIISTPLVKIGQNAGLTNQGASSIAIGNSAGNTNQGAFSVAIGLNCATTQQGVQSVAIGEGAGQQTQGNNAVAIGYISGRYNQGGDCVAIGSVSATSGQKVRAVAVGYQAGYTNQGTQSIAIGQSAGYQNQSQESYAIGGGAGFDAQKLRAIAIGRETGFCNQGTDSIAIGWQAGRSNQGTNAIAIGNTASDISQGNGAIAIGFQAARFRQGDLSIAIGQQSGITQQGIFSIAIGAGTGNCNQNMFAVAIGNGAGQQTQGTGAVAIGNGAGLQTQGEAAIAIGQNAGRINQGSASIAIGWQTDLSGASNSIAVGLNAQCTFNNSIVLNASGALTSATTSNATFVNPLRGVAAGRGVGVVLYDPITKELYYSTT